MPIDTSIYQSLIKPKSVGDFQAEYDQRQLSQQALQQNALGLQQSRQKLDEYGRTVREGETVRNALAGLGAGATDEQRVNALYGTGVPAGYTQADAIRKQMVERQKAKAEAAKTNAGLLKQYSGILVQSPTMQTFESLAAHYTQQTGENIDNIRAIVQQSGGDPEVIRKIGAALSMEADKLLPTIKQQDNGGSNQTLAIDPLTGKPTVTSTTAKTQTPDNVARLAQSASQFTATQAAATDKAAAPPKPLPASALKMQQESLDAIGISSSINADLGAIEKQITDGKLSFGPVSNAINAGRNAIGKSSEESRNFGSFKSTLERLRNESLRLNTGVQTDGDAQRAWNELFQNINDTELVKQRLTEIQGINKRGAELHRLRVDSVRSNYGAEPLDSSAYTKQPAAVGAKPGGPKPGAVEDGHRFKGGDPADPKNWEKV